MPDVVFVLMLLAVALLAGAVRYKMFKRIMRNSGQREDGTWEPGRAPSDATLVGKIAMGVVLLAFVVAAVLRLVDDAPGWLWALTTGVMAVAMTTLLVSERRRIRREGVDVGHGPGRLRSDD
ncbi:hypothetical protein [Georgenia wangjunii]|uniref:hypothetical protein n=1 Tax=Georgenia wangjunii TaxID=3117730 RepID=UPI002F26156A